MTTRDPFDNTAPSAKTPTNATAFSNTEPVRAAVHRPPVLAAVRAATYVDEIANLSSTLKTGGVIDGVTLAKGDRVLVKDVALATNNGVFIVADTFGAATRASDFDANSETIPGTLIPVERGTRNAGKRYSLVATEPVVVGISDLTFSEDTAWVPASPIS